MNPSLEKKLNCLIEIIKKFQSVLVAYSGGVDSSFLLYVAYETLKENAVGLTVHSETMSFRELLDAKKIVDSFGIRHAVVNFEQLNDRVFRSNPYDRCYYCKSAIFRICQIISQCMGIKHVLDGSNQDDLSDFRPGMKAAEEYGVKRPLLECGLTKEDIRNLSRFYNLPIWNKPATPCLSSRIPFNCEITREKLKRIESAEEILRNYGLYPCRARYHDEILRIEIHEQQLEILNNRKKLSEIIPQIKQIGFKFVTLDLEGLKSGVFNP